MTEVVETWFYRGRNYIEEEEDCRNVKNTMQDVKNKLN